MYKAPFSRRILPWMYALVFCIVAPLLLLYTSGYRYNLKKHAIERHGVLIIDGAPTEAEIFLDGVSTGKTLPYTFQNVTPGWHTVSVRKSGYSEWEKRLEIRSEQVTFANALRLWPKTQPQRLLSEPVRVLESNPEETSLGVLVEEEGAWRAGVWNGRAARLQLTSTPLLQEGAPYSLRWNAQGSSFLLNGLSTQPTYWTSALSPLHTDRLPNGIYHWSDEYTLIGGDDTSFIRLQARSNRLSREELTNGVLYRDQEASLQATGTPPLLFLTKYSLQDRVYQLPSLGWRIIDQFGDIFILKEKQTDHWMALDTTEPSPYAGEVYGDRPRWWQSRNSQERRSLFLHEGEVWVWQPGGQRQLIWRQALPLREAVWDPEGTHVILADRERVWALELDERDGREVTPLATFEEIYDLARLDQTLYIAGRLQGAEGVWAMELDTP